MRGLLLIDDTTPNRITYYLLVSFLVFLPFRMLYSELALIGLCLHTMINLDTKKIQHLKSANVVVPASLYLLGLVGMLYSPDIMEALNVSGRQLAMLLFPIVLTLNGINLARYKLVLLKIFAGTCITAIIYLFAVAFLSIHSLRLPLKSILSPDFMNHNFSLPLDLHATYLSMYATFAVVILLFFTRADNRKGVRVFYITGIIILMAGMIQLSSRAALVALLLIVNIVFPFLLPGRKKKLVFFGIVASLTLVTALFITNIDSFKTRYVGELKNDLGIDTLNVEFTEPRIHRWSAELELISKAPLLGYGSGSERKLLGRKFYEKKFYVAYFEEFNSHNQYLSFLLNMGLVGLLAFLSVLGYGFFLAWKDRDIVFFGFMIIISVLSFSENILFLNKGIFFYSFFLSFFLLTRREAEILRSRAG